MELCLQNFLQVLVCFAFLLKLLGNVFVRETWKDKGQSSEGDVGDTMFWKELPVMTAWN